MKKGFIFTGTKTWSPTCHNPAVVLLWSAICGTLCVAGPKLGEMCFGSLYIHLINHDKSLFLSKELGN